MARYQRGRAAGTQRSIRPSTEVLVIGLGRFGSALADTLVQLGHEVLGLDTDPQRVQDASERLTHVAQADGSNAKALAQLGAGDFEVAVVAIGGDVEASILATSALVDFGVPLLWAKAVTDAHGRILERVGAHHVVFPEHDMGERVAHLVTGRMMDYIELDPGFALVETAAPEELWGKSLADAELRQRHGVTVVCVKPQGSVFTYATPDTVLARGDVLLVAGDTARCERFANLV